MNTEPYAVVKGSIGVGNTAIHEGGVVPVGRLTAEDVRTMLRDGVIEPLARGDAEPESEEGGGHVSPGKWSVDPATLVGLDMEELLQRVLEIDPDFDVDVFEDEGDVVRQLTSEYSDEFQESPAASEDRTEQADPTVQSARELAGSEKAEDDVKKS